MLRLLFKFILEVEMVQSKILLDFKFSNSFESKIVMSYFFREKGAIVVV